MMHRCSVLFEKKSNFIDPCSQSKLNQIKLILVTLILEDSKKIIPLGWAFYSTAIGVALTFVCAAFSGQAEKSTASDKVQDKMNEGKTLICLA